jgi:hypothetical protein
MVDHMARKDLADCLRRLISGEMTTNEFTDRYDRQWEHSLDPAVAEIGDFGWSLYSDWSFSYRLRGLHAVTAWDCQVAERAMLFLGTDLEYEWPRDIQEEEDLKEFEASGDLLAWPFRRMADWVRFDKRPPVPGEVAAPSVPPSRERPGG